MPNVITKEEFTQMMSIVRPLVLRGVKNYARQVALGKSFNSAKFLNLKLMCYLRSLMLSWEQSKFTNEEYSNYLSDAGLRNTYANILKLSKDA